MLAALSVREPERAIRVRPGLPRDIQAVLDHGLARAPQKRYAAAGDMARDLRAILEFRPVSVRPTSTITRIGRRISRSRAALGALAAAALIATVAMGSAWRTRSLEAAQQRFTEAWRHVPANLGVADPHNRRIESEPLRGTVSGALDRLVTSGWGRAFALAYRGIYRLDQGDARGAQLDLEAARRAEDEAFFGGFDALLEAGEPVDLSALPPPRSSSAKLFGAFYAVRTRQIDLVDGFLEGLDRTLARPGEEYRILTRLAPSARSRPGESSTRLFVRAQEQLDAIAALEEGGASVTANSAYLRGLAQLRQDRHAASIVSLQESALLGPGTHMALQNIGTAGERGGFYRAASEALKSALEIAPAHVPMRSSSRGSRRTWAAPTKPARSWRRSCTPPTQRASGSGQRSRRRSRSTSPWALS